MTAAKKAAPRKTRAPRLVAPLSQTASRPRPKSLTTQAYEILEAMIANLELKPGEALSEVELAERLGIGRTPVREALQRLAREHLVQILPQRGVLVSEIDIKRQLRLLEVRREVERLVVRCAARRANEEERQRFEELGLVFEEAGKTGDQVMFMRADKEFNDLSVRAARNEFAAGAMGLMHGLSRRFWFLHYKQADDLLSIACLHSRLSAAIGRRDENAAGQALDDLIDHNETFTKATLNLEY